MPTVLKMALVVGPGGIRDVDLSLHAELLVLVESLEEDSTQMVGTGSRDGLNGSDALLGDRRRVGAEDELGGGICELGQTARAGDDESAERDPMVSTMVQESFLGSRTEMNECGGREGGDPRARVGWQAGNREEPLSSSYGVSRLAADLSGIAVRRSRLGRESQCVGARYRRPPAPKLFGQRDPAEDCRLAPATLSHLGEIQRSYRQRRTASLAREITHSTSDCIHTTMPDATLLSLQSAYDCSSTLHLPNHPRASVVRGAGCQTDRGEEVNVVLGTNGMEVRPDGSPSGY
ncbi:hypothetical protein L1887_53991 [Cichorium endivia]|nr:hypothetical protein L1887_53991 [Cichorium endivia]